VKAPGEACVLAALGLLRSRYAGYSLGSRPLKHIAEIMPSQAATTLAKRLADFDEILAARDHFCPRGAGKPAQRKGAALLRAGTVMLAAALEAYVEELFDAGVDLVFAAASADDRKTLKKNTSERLNNASVFKVDMLYFNLGIPWVMQSPKLCWQKCNNASVRTTLDAIINARNRIAHGTATAVTKPKAKRWRSFTDQFPRKFDEVIADHINTRTGARPW